MAGGLGNFRAVPSATRLPSQTTAELLTLRQMADTVRQVADDIDPDIQDEGPKPHFLRGDFDANLAEELLPMERNRIGSDLLRGIEADLETRKEWAATVERAIKFCGLIYEEASGEASSEGSISKVWHTLVLESAIGFWANAYAEFLPAAGPVKVRDDQGPTLDDEGNPAVGPNDPSAPPPGAPKADSLTRTQLAEAFEKFFNRYLTVNDKQYYRDFSRMLFSLGPKGTEFRKVYFNPLRRMIVSEWVKSENLIISNDAADLSTAGRITERIMMRNADVKRMQWRGHWLDVPLSQPVDQPTRIEETIGQSQGIQPRIQLPADQLHTIYECCCELDLPGFEHEEDGEETGLPLPYRVTLDKDSRQILEIRRHWKEGDENFEARQRYVMFGLLPGFGLYFLGYAHILGNTERALTAMEREVIDNTMLAIFPGWFAAKGAFSRGNTQVRYGPMGVVEVDLGMNKSVNDVIQPVQVAQIGPAHMALFDKLEQNGRAVSGKFDVPVGEGTANIPVGTMIAMIENGTKMMAAVHKGLHASRSEEFELMRELMAENPETLIRFSKDEIRWDEVTEELLDLDLVPSSDPNTPSHVHRVMKASGLAQIAQMFPDLANRSEILDELLSVLQVAKPSRFINPNPQTPPDPKAADAATKLQIAQINATTKAQDTETRARQSQQDAQAKIATARIGAQGEAIKTQAQERGQTIRAQMDAQADALRQKLEHAHDAQMQQVDKTAELQQSREQRAHDAREGHMDRNQPPQRMF